MRRRRRRRQQCKRRCVGPRCGATSSPKLVRTWARGRSRHRSSLLTWRARSSAIIAALLFVGRRTAHKARPLGSSRHGYRGHHRRRRRCRSSGHRRHQSSSSVIARRWVKCGPAHRSSRCAAQCHRTKRRCAAKCHRTKRCCAAERHLTKRPSVARLRGVARASTAGAWPSSRTCASRQAAPQLG